MERFNLKEVNEEEDMYNVMVSNRFAALEELNAEVDIIVDHQCRFRHNRSTTDPIFCICQTLKKKNGSKMRQYISYSWTSSKPIIQ
jgi:hypothetical protein